MKQLLIAASLLSAITLTQCDEAEHQVGKIESKADMSFAKDTFEELARGDSSVVDKIDWPMLQSMGEDVGAEYSQLPSETQKRNFETSYVTQFASGFQKSGGTPGQFTNWRVSHHDDIKTEVAADSGGGTVTITVTERDGKERVSGLGFIR
ncbi:hypothetical protein [Haloferula sp. BvORR071]|uniref:hypothetical protein n=1 Tax=Haloferula sp. BvORR071 TaxID=1396141 RepID=UPI0005570BA7|nr:hypothetical protein [Haloferula sp. BvORR071]